MRKLLVPLIVILALGAAAGCGQKGPLVPPSDNGSAYHDIRL